MRTITNPKTGEKFETAFEPYEIEAARASWDAAEEAVSNLLAEVDRTPLENLRGLYKDVERARKSAAQWRKIYLYRHDHRAE